MTVKGIALLAGAWLCASGLTARADVSDEAATVFRQGDWQMAILLLEPQRADPSAQRLLALAYFNAQDFDRARPALEQARSAHPNDVELNGALLEVMLADREYAGAGAAASRLAALGAGDAAAFGMARVRLAQGERGSAIDQLQRLVETAEPALAIRAADVLIEALYAERRYGLAYEVAQTALQRDPESPQAYRFTRVRPDPVSGAGFSLDLAYRFDYDDNVTFPDEAFGSGQEDYRHVLMGDLLYRRTLGKGWLFYAEGHALQSFHNDFGEFDRTRLSGATAVGYQGQRLGWRLPIEVQHDRLDGDAWRTTVAALPGVSLQFTPGLLGRLYARIQQDDYRDAAFLQEDRSGDVNGAGMLLAGTLTPRIQVRSYLEFNRYDTDGAYWEREEWVAFVYGEFEFRSDWVAGLAFRYQDEDYDNARPVFADRQQVESKEVYLNLTYRFAQHWSVRGQVSLIDHASNIPIFDYDRHVYSFSVVRGF